MREDDSIFCISAWNDFVSSTCEGNGIAIHKRKCFLWHEHYTCAHRHTHVHNTHREMDMHIHTCTHIHTGKIVAL